MLDIFISTLLDKPESVQAVKTCPNCLSAIARGKNHHCTLTSRLENVQNFIQDSGPKFRDQVISQLVTAKMMENGKEKSMTLTQPRGGQPLTITVGANIVENRKKRTLLSVEDFRNLQSSFNLSQKTTCGIASTLRISKSNCSLRITLSMTILLRTCSILSTSKPKRPHRVL